MTSKVLLATHNDKKLVELRRIVEEAGLDIEIVSLHDVPEYPEPAETEWTFEGNALIKAAEGTRRTGLPSIADDSGLCVDALGGMPGVRSSRWAGPGHNDQANLDLVLAQIDDVEAEKRTAQFVSVVAIVMPDGRKKTVRGEMPGRLTFEELGENGFGYDPIFIADEQEGNLTTAQMSSKDKDAISHRGKALRQILPVLAQMLGLDQKPKA